MTSHWRGLDVSSVTSIATGFLAPLKNDHTKPSPLVRLFREFSTFCRRRYFQKLYQWDSYDEQSDKVYFPLHVQPEASTMTYAPFYLDQLSIIENLSKSLPVNFKLIVKEHPSMLGMRDKRYYERLRSLPNIALINPFTDNFKVIKEAKLIFTITGTTGLEGLIFKKPVITLGSVFFKYCPLVKQAGEISPVMWPQVIAEMLEQYEHDEVVLNKFLAALFERAFAGCYVEPLRAPELILNDANLQLLTDKLAAYLQEQDGTASQVDKTQAVESSCI